VSWFLEAIQKDGYAVGQFCQLENGQVTGKAFLGTTLEAG